jgi:hypothetical protein
LAQVGTLFADEYIVRGDDMSKVLDMTKRRKAQLEKEQATVEEPAEVLDFEEKREILVKKERRSGKRTVLTEILGSYIVVPQKGLQKVALYDISEHGVSFDLSREEGCLREGEEVALRIYISHVTYFPLVVKVTNIRFEEDEEVFRHGAGFIKELINEEALGHFVRFINAAGVSLRTDSGDLISSNSQR